ncbi:hypothetical protein [Sphingomonas mucosissima]|uniref:Uncharacterized protein n=1 Tax=Sphingomonas mucosissima TaxID=370959 RepID=A0A245ZMK5_9SPHN|nr:hypothetical protein [Sphingomonas mucosissima]OWK30964.1 hypothetical protein SPMU_19560 [Sphingomonas mucosissima]
MSLLLACAVAACGQPATDTSANTIAAPVAANGAATAPAPAPAAGEAAALKLSGAADAASIAATLAEAKRQGMSDAKVTAAQSFRITEGGREIATVLTGEGKMPDATFAGCFVALRTGDNVELIPTLGYGDYEAQTCGGPTAVAILSSGDPVRFGMTFHSYSQDAEETVPMVVTWSRGDGSLLIDTELSTKAANSGIKTVAGMRPLVR